MTVHTSIKQSSVSLNDRIAASQNKCAQATQPPKNVDSFQRIGKPGNNGGGIGAFICSPTATVGGIVSTATSPVTRLLNAIIGLIVSPFVTTTASRAS